MASRKPIPCALTQVGGMAMMPITPTVTWDYSPLSRAPEELTWGETDLKESQEVPALLTASSLQGKSIAVSRALGKKLVEIKRKSKCVFSVWMAGRWGASFPPSTP